MGVACGVLIISGAVLQHSGQRLKVGNGSAIVVIATIVGAPAIYFGMLIGGILSVIGAYLGLTWKPRGGATPQSLNSAWSFKLASEVCEGPLLS